MPHIKTIPAHQASVAPAAYYLPDLSVEGVGQLHLNFQSWRHTHPWQTEALLHHEAIPGHHFQFSQIATESLNDFERSSWFNSTVEGWGLYAEHLADALDFYTTPDGRVGRLFLELFRAARLVVDTGLHAFGWSFEEAADYLIENSLLSASQAAAEIERYTEYPAQALSYQLGKLSWTEAIGEPSSSTLTASLPVLRRGIIPVEALLIQE